MFYLDYGDMDLIKYEQVAPITQADFKMPCQAIECSLINISPCESDWTEADSEVLWDLVENPDKTKKILFAKVKLINVGLTEW